MRDAIRLTNTCTHQGLGVVVSAQSTASYTATSLSVHSTDRQTQSAQNGDHKVSCSVELKPATFNYQFKGSCLQLNMSGSNETLTLVPGR